VVYFYSGQWWNFSPALTARARNCWLSWLFEALASGNCCLHKSGFVLDAGSKSLNASALEFETMGWFIADLGCKTGSKLRFSPQLSINGTEIVRASSTQPWLR